MKLRKAKTTKGFTLVELLVVIAIIAILSTITIIGYTSFIKKSANSSDKLLVDQINTIINGQRIYEEVYDDNAIAKLLQDYIGNDVKIASKKYDMDIYYNRTSKQFELLSKDEAQNLNNLDYYLNRVTFSFNNVYQTFETITDFNRNNQVLKSYLNNDTLYIEISTNDEKTISPKVDLNQFINAFDSNGNKLDIEFTVIEKDIVQTVSNSFSLQGDILEVYNPGIYQITYKSQDVEGIFDLYVKNVYWPNSPQIDASQVKPFATLNQGSTLTVKLNVYDKLRIQDYTSGDGQFSMLYVNENKEWLENTDIIITVGNQTEIVSMNTTNLQYTITFDSSELTTGDTISITFRYRGYNGEYCYSSEIITIIQ